MYRLQNVAWYLRGGDRMRNPTCKKDRKSSHGFLYSGSRPTTFHNFTAHPFPKYQATFCDLYISPFFIRDPKTRNKPF
jgi:hypothetical protein